VWAPLILLLAFADRFLNEWNFDSLTAQIAMGSSSALTIGFGRQLGLKNIILKIRWKMSSSK
jgi:hypothetical protein